MSNEWTYTTAASMSPSGGWSIGGGAAWLFLVIFLIVIAALITWWVLAITMPARPKDLEVCDLQARDVTTSGNTCLGGNLTVAGNVNHEAATIIKALSLPPTPDSRLVIALDGTQTSIVLTSSVATAPSVELPPGGENPGLVVAVFNESGSASFSVSPNSTTTDTIEGAAGPVAQTSSAVFVSMGTLSSGIADWKQIV